MKNISVLLMLLVLSSCQIKPDFDSLTLQDFFFKPADFSTPKILVFDVDSAGILSTIYYKIEMKSDNDLLVTKYNKDLLPSEFQQFTYKDDGVHLRQASFIVDYESMERHEAEIVQGYTFPFTNAAAPIHAENKFSLYNDSIQVQNKATWQFDKISTQDIKGEERLIIIAKAKAERIITENGKSHTTKIKTEAWYAENLGVSKISAHFPKWSYSEMYRETISLEEFEAIIL